MTSYIPSITLPAQVFAQPAASILLPIALGTGIGFAIRRKHFSSHFVSYDLAKFIHHLGVLLPVDTQRTYLALKQPPYRPPPYVFGPMWTVLYGAMGFAAYRAWTTGMASLNPETRELTKQGATLYTIQLGLNLLWMPLFFGLKRPIEATVDIVALTGITAYLTYIWGQVDVIAGWSLVPYLGWLGFATYLSAGVGHLNDWNMADKEVERSPASKGDSTKYVDEVEDKKSL
ncbi:hypothetical protein MMC19_002993 [Ptychographa xylographoides]|nr:hypothetical protein [Ptychographa xylographoides]